LSGEKNLHLPLLSLCLSSRRDLHVADAGQTHNQMQNTFIPHLFC
jgi:hypothetical protein